MRLAEFKMRLFVFFAHRFLKWAGLSQTTVPLVANSQGSTEGGQSSRPPEHWQRLFPSGPPEHWLDLFRVKAVPLPDEVDRAGEIANGEARTEWPEIGDHRPQSPARMEREVRRQRGRNLASYSASERHAWLNRLRFFPPQSRPESELHIPHAAVSSRARTKYVRSFPNDYKRAVREVSTNRSELADPMFSEDVQTAAINETEYVHGSVRESDVLPLADYKQSRSNDSIQEVAYQDSVGVAANELTFADQASSYDQQESTLSFARSTVGGNKTELSFVQSSCADQEFPLQVTPHVSTVANELEIFSAERPRRVSSITPAGQESRKTTDTRSSTFFVESRRSSRASSFNQIDTPARRPTPQTLFDDASTCWPRLPDSPAFNFSDEFLLRKDEFEAVKRLEREQNGNRWNE